MENFKRANSDFFHFYCLRFSYNRKKYELSFHRFKLVSKPLNTIFSFLCPFPVTRKLKKKEREKEEYGSKTCNERRKCEEKRKTEEL